MSPDQAYASRIRDNKRRFRQRRKEYVADLERAVKEHRQQGVQATKEVQLSARKVARENFLLRQLLGLYGADEKVVNDWIGSREDKLSAEENAPVCARRCIKDISRGKVSEIAKVAQASPGSISERLPSLRLDSLESEPNNVEFVRQCLKSTGCSSSKRETSLKCKQSSPTQAPALQCSASVSDRPQDSAQSIVPEAPRSPEPCKLITHLAANPQTDLTQIPVSNERLASADDKADGVECSKAYQMLISYATTEEKLGTVALALERGCVKSQGGGCKVQNEAVWKALDELTR